MEEYRTKQGYGSLMLNGKKSLDTDADYSGSINISGEEERIYVWLRKDETTNTPFLRAVTGTTKVQMKIDICRKESEKAPEYKGSFDYNGKKYFIAGWIGQTKTGKAKVSLSVSEATKPTEGKPATPPTAFPTAENMGMVYGDALYPTMPKNNTIGNTPQGMTPDVVSDELPF